MVYPTSSERSRAGATRTKQPRTKTKRADAGFEPGPKREEGEEGPLHPKVTACRLVGSAVRSEKKILGKQNSGGPATFREEYDWGKHAEVGGVVQLSDRGPN